jgi:GAF domain-containing protein
VARTVRGRQRYRHASRALPATDAENLPELAQVPRLSPAATPSIGHSRPVTDDGFDEELLTRVLSEFAHTLADRFEVSEVLYRLAEHVVDILAVAGTGVSVVDENGDLRPVTGINELTTGLEAAEERLQEGPCVDAFHQGELIVVTDLDEQAHRWPRWAAEAKERGVRAVIGLPLRVRTDSLGAMNIYSDRPRQWRQAEIRVARVLTDMAASYVANASDLEQSQRTTEQLREALDSRIIIEQAKGVLAAEMGVDVDQAFQVLRSHARRHSVSLRSVAHGVVHLGLRPTTRAQR